MAIDDRTINLNLPLPNAANKLSEDVGRLRTALTDIDTAVAGKAATGHLHAGVYEPADSTILKSAAIGVTVQAHAPAATQTEMEAGTVTALRSMSPERVKQAILALAPVAASGMSISISGPTTVYVSQSVTWTVVDFDAFSTYAVAASAGSISISGSTISYTAPASAQTVTLTLTVNGQSRTVSLSILPAGVATPTNIAPADLATEQDASVTLSASAFQWLGVSTTHLNADWQLASNSNFTTIVQSASADATNKTSWTVSGLSVSTTYYWRVRYRSASGLVSDWSTGTRFTTKSSFNSYIATPTATPANFGDALEGGFYAGMIWNQVTQSTSSKTLATGTQTFTVPDMNTTPMFYAGQALEVRSRANPANKFIGTVTGALGTTLTLNVTSIGGSGTFSDWSVMARFRIIVAPKSSGENAGIALKNANDAFPTACQTLTEGLASTNAMQAAGSSSVYPAAHWARGLSIGGRSDWYVPARDELELCWRNLKPVTNSNYTSADRSTGASFNYANNGSVGDTSASHGVNNNSLPTGGAYTTSVPGQTAATAFRSGGSEAFEFGSSYYWSSSEYSASFAWFTYNHTGAPGSQVSNSKTNSYRVRAVRRSII